MVEVTKPGNFAFKIQINKRLATKVRGTVYNVGPDGTPDPSVKVPSLWGNTPIDGIQSLEYLKSAESAKIVENTDTQTDSHMTS
ncbi:hypothetical protein DPMN_129797 [Dreissena polymorpha]|uniref:Uncharacterized protein n=1 Tax=Dreissena polymorpha TaxID=45954 RepID=A0A9D4JYK7_DREPO|nr:hypothetical protein DPMN_129797 [Dreissena polymorpha]